MSKYYIAYGSNLNIMQMKLRCPDAEVIGKSFIEGYELLFKGSKTGSYLTIEKSDGKHVPVAIWKISDRDEQRLDKYEGYPNFYYKKDMELQVKEIETGKKRKLKCFVYIMHEDRELGIPYKEYVKTCLEGYQLFGFKFRYIENAYKKSVEVKNAKQSKTN